MLIDLIPARCQQQIPIGSTSVAKLIFKRLRDRIRIRTRLRSLLAPPVPTRPRLGKPSQFLPGDWVRVLDRDRIRATLDSHDKLRGLWFAEQQWPYCGSVLRVTKVVRRMLDDNGNMRPVSRTVFVDQACCGGVTGDSGCGRDCPLMFRDEWLEPAEAPSSMCSHLPEGGTVTVRSALDIQASLNKYGRRDGLLLMPEMLQYSGRTFRVHRMIENIFEHGRPQPLTRPVYLLDGLFCSGDILGEDGPCHRGCRLLWHRDWLSIR